MFRLLLILISAVVFVPASFGYVEPSFYILKTISKKHAGLKSGKFKHKLTFYEDGEVQLVLNETLLFIDQETAIVRITNSEGKELTTRKRDLVRFPDGKISRPLSYDLLMVRDFESVFEHFKELGLPLKSEDELYSEKGENEKLPYRPEEKVNFFRFESRPAIVIGDPMKKEKFQLWVEKSSLMPMRAVLSDFVEYRVKGYRQYDSGKSSRKYLLYPREVEIYKNEKLWAKIETLSVRLTNKVKFRPSKEKVEMDGDAKDFLNWYFKWVR